MNKTEWDVMTAEEKYELIKDKVFDGNLFVMKRRSVGTTEFAMNNIISNFTTDRNSCALVLDEIEKMGKYESLISLLVEYRPEDQDLDGCTFCDVWWGLRADPDTICYCAVRVIERAAEYENCSVTEVRAALMAVQTDATTRIAERFGVDEEMIGEVVPGMTWEKARQMKYAALDEEPG